MAAGYFETGLRQRLRLRQRRRQAAVSLACGGSVRCLMHETFIHLRANQGRRDVL